MLGIGVVGLGRAASGMLPAFIAHPGVRVVALAEPQAALREAFCADFSVTGYADAAQLCGDPEVDVVYVATPHQMHATHSALAASEGKHVLVEKPMALTLEECDQMIAAAKKAGVVLMVGQTNGYDAPVLALGGLTRSGRFGKLRMVNTAHYSDFLYRPRRPEELDTNLGGGIMYNQFPHQVEMVRVIADGAAAERVSAVCGVWDCHRPTEGAVSALIRLRDGVVASITYNGYAHLDSRALYLGLDDQPARPRPPAIRPTVLGLSSAEEAAAKSRSGYLARREAFRAPPAPSGHHERFGLIVASYDDADVVPTPSGLAAYTDGGVEELPVAFGTGGLSRSTVVDELVAATEGRPPLHDGTWGKATMAVCFAALESSRRGTEVAVAD